MTGSILGTGFAHPIRPKARGSIQEAGGVQKIRESILIILGTQRGERVMRPTFGCDLKRLVFAPNNAATANLARHYVEEGLATWEPRIIVDEVTVENDNANVALRIHITYRIKSTFEPQHLVYPFYLTPA